ncbi:MAG: hypothetical protein GXX92_05015 [Clostridiales bacterium]|nr:hypothetical protein [Clostridiales bacterium]
MLESILCMALAIVLLFTSSAGASSPPVLTLSDPNEQLITESIEVENVLTENRLTTFITEEIYLEEIILAEDKITELLLEEETIDEVILCKTIYVPKENIEEFAANSQTAQLFGDDIDITSLLKKVAVGTGVILTVLILKKSGLAEPIASIVAGAADESLKFAIRGAGMGTLFGGLTGAADGMDESGRLSAVIGFATATVGLIVAIVSFVGVIPSGGTTAMTAPLGVKLIIAGVSLLTASAGTAYTGHNVIKKFTATDSVDIDWENIDWEKVGLTSAQRAINNGADGYMWGSIIGVIHGGAEAYYQKHCTPYTKYSDRLTQASYNKGGHWSGDIGESDFILDNPIDLPNGTKIIKITYKNAVPDFSPIQEAHVKIPRMTEHRNTINGIKGNFEQADEALAEIWTSVKYNGRPWTASDVKTYRSDNLLSWHEMSNMESMQLVPREIHATFKHYGGVAECKAMIGQEGGAVFD